ncbi:MFS general substrate transporter [Pseudohyphozyma bogoriensis]|nr:MFS general substrate transporter [Pseudohyphozyma bogoriensis]
MSGFFQKAALGRLLYNVFDWYPAHLSATDRRLLRKLDLSILVFASLSFFCKFLDQTNVTNAYNSGMKEDVGLDGNALNYLNAAYYSTYVVFQIPTVLLQTRPHIAPHLLPVLEVVWAILTFASSVVKKPWHLYLIRAIIGAAEAPSFAATHVILGSWYREEELFKRAGTWFMCNSLGSMFSGYLQAAAYNNLNGVMGRAGWQWLFIVDGVITLPIAIIGFAFFPGLPSSKKPWFLTAEEHARASARLPKNHKQAGPLNRDVFKRTFSSKTVYYAVAIYTFQLQAFYWQAYMSLWLKAVKVVDSVTGQSVAKYSISQINIYPTFVNLISAFASWFGATIAGGGVVPPWVVFSAVETPTLFSVICLTVWNIPDGLKFACFYLASLGGCTSPIFYSWINTILRHDPEQRALVMAMCMTVGYAMYAWVPLFTFPTVQAPQFPRGYPVTLGLILIFWPLFLYAIWIHRNRKPVDHADEKAIGGSVEEEDEKSEGSVVGASALDK